MKRLSKGEGRVIAARHNNEVLDKFALQAIVYVIIIRKAAFSEMGLR